MRYVVELHFPEGSTFESLGARLRFGGLIHQGKNTFGRYQHFLHTRRYLGQPLDRVEDLRQRSHKSSKAPNGQGAAISLT